MASKSSKSLAVVGVGSWTYFDHLFVVERLPAPGDTVQIESAGETIEQVHFGGCAPNNVAAAARLGAHTGLVGVAGRDFESRGYRAYLEGLGVDLSGLVVVEDDRCGQSFLYSDREGQSICLSHLGAAARQEQYTPDAGVLAQARVGIINYRFDRFTLGAARLVKSTGGTVMVSGALMTSPNHADAFTRTTDVLVSTQHELGQLVAFLGLREAPDLFGRGIKAIVATRGKLGSRIVTAERTVDIPLVEARRVVDTTGAGDAFAGGVAYGLAVGYLLEDAARLGAVVASFVVEAIGCQTNLPTLAQAAERFERSFHMPLVK